MLQKECFGVIKTANTTVQELRTERDSLTAQRDSLSAQCSSLTANSNCGQCQTLRAQLEEVCESNKEAGIIVQDTQKYCPV